MNLKQHALSAAFPPMGEEDYKALKDSIEAVGVLNPIVIFEGQAIDGWHRYSAATELGMPCPTVELDDTDPIDFVKAMNEARRHMTASQRAVAIVSIYGWRPVGQPKKNTEPGSQFTKTNVQLAKEAGVSTKTIEQAKTAKKAGLDVAVRDGDLTVKEAANIAKGKPAKPEPSKPQPAPETEAEAPEDYTELDAARDQISELQSALAVANMGDVDEEGKLHAATLIADLQSELKMTNAVLKATTAERDRLMQENAMMKRQMKAQRAEIEKLKG